MVRRTPDTDGTEGGAAQGAPGATLVDDLAARIRDMIMGGDIPIGGQLRQAELATLFGVSRTPIREAIRQLQNGGLIAVHPHRGAVVRVPAPWEVREAYEVRAELEALAARRAVARITREQLDELESDNREMYEQSAAQGEGRTPVHRAANDAFHTLISEVAGNARLTRSIEDINGAFPRNVSSQLIVNDSRHRDENFAEHERIIAALRAGDADAAAAEMRAHVIAAGDALARWYEQRSATVFVG
ncbi:Transcriptional regulator, GntR family [Pseudonocardia sp. Ae406_Ps2]|uniref:GntR family transcriptional regulator n=1 Tax=unclassified Pseudonocardia TaxID=2619320 RepID=UPI00094AF257|nr:MULTISPECIES: GntR family transcriptional regulator [unclassified Pseudonocardia]OLL99856.1 Transcriptional regulator, GntR family [Pseudonocardia sp. Ae331_Ps2]OLM02394.1 Transcriptional regulator, GntR family [Pseudonocardia sp. Ae406_Ps2]OLM12770.1 Transcriptional regulator, GntR family [Pseudonocardia sp. Ae505_Ps2]OLM23966.1 Transcriptional regulator, GntR family [Pseudonocardia sp. Ae706_Ps2]